MDAEQLIPPPVWVWGLPLAPLTFHQTVAAVDRFVQSGAPRYFITANLHYAMLTAADPRLQAVNDRAAFLVADGAPLVWASRRALPERVAGADLVPALCGLAARRGYRVFFLGGDPGVGEEAARRLAERCPGLSVVGLAAPVLDRLSPSGHAELAAHIRAARPHLLFAALSQPRGEFWLHDHRDALGVPISVQVGAGLDFAAGRVRRAPGWVQKAGLEWAYRISREPKRLTLRYVRNALFAARMLVHDFAPRGRPGPRPASDPTGPRPPAAGRSLP
jgi:N-acetylglucosaminyldiphosphoundecaprenol N-acetyl-beta-D-mannosaminyltransferase